MTGSKGYSGLWDNAEPGNVKKGGSRRSRQEGSRNSGKSKGSNPRINYGGENVLTDLNIQDKGFTSQQHMQKVIKDLEIENLVLKDQLDKKNKKKEMQAAELKQMVINTKDENRNLEEQMDLSKQNLEVVMSSTGDNRIMALQNNYEGKMKDKFQENERLKFTKNELDKEVKVLQAKCQNLQTTRSVSSFGDLTRDDLLKRIHDLEVEVANKDQHYKN